MNITDNDATRNEIPAVAGYVRTQRDAAFATAIEAARFLGVSKPMIHKMIGQGKMPVRRYGRAVRIPWSWLRAPAE